MKVSLKLNLHKFLFNSIILLLWIKLIFSYLSIKLGYFQRHLIPNVEKYNFLGLPAEFSNKIEFILLPFLFSFIILNIKILGKIGDLFWLSILMLLLNLVTGILNSVSLIDSINFTLKIYAPIYLFLSILIYSRKYNNEKKLIVKKTLILCVVLTVIGILFFDPSFNRLELFLPIYFGSIHTQSYLLVAVFIGASYFLYRNNYKSRLIIFLFLTLLFLYFGYNVKTAILMYLLYVITILFLISNFFKFVFVKIIIFAPLILIFGLLFLSVLDINEYSSGRLDMYAVKIDQLSKFGVLDWLFGTGYGSDLVETEIWWWAKKGSHSDVISFLVENGILYLALFFLTVIRFIFLNNKVNLIFASIIVGCFVSGLISNGIFVRPIASYILFMVLAYIFIDLKKTENLTPSELKKEISVT